jgi:hypothetical protein
VKLEDAFRLYMATHDDRNHSRKTVRWYPQMVGPFLRHIGPGATHLHLGEVAPHALTQCER